MRETGRGDERDEHLEVVPDRAHAGPTIQVTVVDGSTPAAVSLVRSASSMPCHRAVRALW
jgi:hypothetical protein